MKYDERYGGPFDRGCADYYYGRGYNPHFYKGDSYSSDRVNQAEMALEEIAAYDAGYEQARKSGFQKDWRE